MPSIPKTNRKVTKNEECPNDAWILRLYVAGQTPNSLIAFDNLRKICDDHLESQYAIEVIDLLKNPQLAKDEEGFGKTDVGVQLPWHQRRMSLAARLGRGRENK